MGQPGLAGPAGKDGVGPPPAPAFVEPGDWPKGNCYTPTQQCGSLGVTDNLCGQCAPVCDRCDADVGFKLVNPEGLRFGAATFDASNLAKGSVQARNMCILARYGNGGTVTTLPTAASFAVATTDASKTRGNWYGGCTAGDTRSCCDNGILLASSFDWTKFAVGSTCNGNKDRSMVTVELSCFFDDDIQYDLPPPPDPDPVDYFDIPEVLESDEEPWAAKLVNVGGTCQLAIQDSGNLVVSKVAGQDVVWQAGSDSAGGKAPFNLGIFGQGNLVLSDANGKSLWSTSTAGSGATRAILFKDCNLCLVKDYVGKGDWSRGSGQPLIDSTPSTCRSMAYPSCRANPSCIYDRKWGCFPKSTKSDGTKQWCRDLGRPRSVCVKNPKCKYDVKLGCYASFSPSAATRASEPSSLYMMNTPAEPRQLPAAPHMTALEASLQVKPHDGFSGEFRLDPASELDSRRRHLLSIDDGDSDALSQFDSDDDMPDDDLEDILSDSDDDGDVAHHRGRHNEMDMSARAGVLSDSADGADVSRRRARRHGMRVSTGAAQLADAPSAAPTVSATDPSGDDYIWCSLGRKVAQEARVRRLLHLSRRSPSAHLLSCVSRDHAQRQRACSRQCPPRKTSGFQRDFRRGELGVAGGRLDDLRIRLRADEFRIRRLPSQPAREAPAEFLFLSRFLPPLLPPSLHRRWLRARWWHRRRPRRLRLPLQRRRRPRQKRRRLL